MGMWNSIKKVVMPWADEDVAKAINNEQNKSKPTTKTAPKTAPKPKSTNLRIQQAQ